MKNLNRSADKKSVDPIDKLIFEKGLRISYLMIDKKLDLLIAVLNNSKVIRLQLSDYARLKKATVTQLNKWKLIGGGIGVCWEALDEDLSVKGMIKTAAINGALRNLLSDKESLLV